MNTIFKTRPILFIDGIRVTGICFVLPGDNVELVEYENTAPGLIKSFVERFPAGELHKSLQDLWDKDKQHFYC